MAENTDPFVYRFTVIGTIQSVVETVNVYYYAGMNEVSSVDDLCSNFSETVINPLLPLMHGASAFTELQFQGVKGDFGFTVKPLTAAGSASGEGLPPYASWDFTYLRQQLGERNGYKRIGGLSESQQGYGIPTPSALALLNLAAAGMASTITDGTNSYTPVIHRTRVNRIPVHPAKYYGISTVAFSKIGTQNSRKFGHGA